MRVIYYQLGGVTYVIAVRGWRPSLTSLILDGCNACSWMVPGTFEEDAA